MHLGKDDMIISNYQMVLRKISVTQERLGKPALSAPGEMGEEERQGEQGGEEPMSLPSY